MQPSRLFFVQQTVILNLNQGYSDGYGTFSGTLAYIATKSNTVKDAWSVWQASGTTDAALNLTKEIAQIAGVSAASALIEATLISI